MARVPRGPQPDPWAASDQAEFRALLRALQQWAGYFSLERLEEAATRRGTSMPPSTANRALNNDKLPTADFVRRFAMACDVDVTPWTSARDALHDLKYSRDTATTGPVKNCAPGAQNRSDPADFCPYPGLSAFRSDQAQLFFGREQVTAELLSLLTDRMVGAGPLIVGGPSGAGKSSLLRAGLLASLSEGRLPGSREFVQLVFTPTADPLGALGAQLAAAGSDSQKIVSELSNDPQRIVEVIGKLTGTGQPHSNRAVIVVDQFEELFTLCPDEQHRQAFVRALCAAAAQGGGALVVLGLRADHYGGCAAHPQLIDALRMGHLLLGAMTNAQLRSAIEKPALAAGYALEPGLAEVMLRDLGRSDTTPGESGYQAGALPLLSHALLATWQQHEDRTLTLAGYRLVGGISGAITKTAERVYGRLGPGQQETARSVLLGMVQVGDGVDDTRRQIEWSRLVAESTDPTGVEKVLNELIDARLVTIDKMTVTIVHEILLRAWPRLRQWIDADREELLLQQRLAQAAQAWDRDGRHESDLYRGHRLAALRQRLDAADPRFPVLTSEFLRASVSRERAEERDRRQGRRRGRLSKLSAVLSALALIATATVITLNSRNDAVQSENVDLSGKAGGAAIPLRNSDRGLAAQLAVAAFRVWDTPEARGAVLSALVNLDLPRYTNGDSDTPVDTVVFNHDGRLLVAASRETTIWKLRDQPTLAAPPIGLPHPQQVKSAAMSHDDKLLATSSADNVLRLWAVADALGGKAQPITVIAHVVAGPVVFNRDDTLLATGGPTRGKIQLRTLTAGNPPRSVHTFSAHEGGVLAMAISPDGRHLASAGHDGAKLWDITKPSPEFVPVGEQNVDVNAVAFTPDGRTLATANGDNTARLFDISDPTKPRRASILGGHLGPVLGVAFSPDGKILVTTSQDTTARLWTIRDPDHYSPLATPLAGNDQKVTSAAFSPDGHTLAMTGDTQDVRLWETDPELAVNEICATLSSPLNPAQWDRYFPGRAYQSTCPPHADSAVRNVPAAAPPGSTPLVATHSDKCVAVKDDGAPSGASAYQVDCTKGLGENWTLVTQPAAVPGNAGDHLVKIVNAASGMCLESAKTERTFRGATQVVQRRCVSGYGAQLWILNVLHQRPESADVVFLGLKDRDCLNIDGEDTANGAYVVRWPCTVQEVSKSNGMFRINANALPQ